MTDEFIKLNLFKGKRLLIKNYIVLKQLKCDKQKFNLFNINIPYEVSSAINVLSVSDCEIIYKTNREGFTYFHDWADQDQNHMFAYTTLFCDKSRKAVITFNVSGSGKVWLNGKCIYGYVNEYCWSMRILDVNLDCGHNDIIIEMDTNDKENVFNMTIADFEYENSEDILALSNTDFRIYPTRCVVWVSENDYLPMEHNYRFTLLQSCENFKKEFEIEIYDWKFSCIDKLNGSFESDIIVNLDKYRVPDEEYNMKNIMVKCILKNQESGDTFSTERIIYISDFTSALNTIISKAMDVSSRQPKAINDNIIGKVNMLKNAYKYHEFARVYWGLRQMNDLLYKVNKNEIAKDFYTLPGNHDFYIYSELDKSHVNIKAHVSDSYDRRKPTPAIFALATSKEGYFTQRMDFSSLNEDCLCFDITGRGYTSGSYIGEASIMELINWALGNYSIDRSRMYLLGYSNGAFATWSIAQNYPHMFAAIFPLAGLSIKSKDSDLTDCRIFQIISPDDYLYKKQKNLIETWKNNDNYILYFADDTLHVSMYPQLTNYRIVNKMLKYRKKEYIHETNSYVKNFGMLTVYCGSLRIVIDEKAGENMKKAAENLSKPTSNGMESEIDVKYPIYLSSSLPRDIYMHNLIYLYKVSSEKYSINTFVHENMRVKCSSSGFVYREEKFAGDYVYMQIVPQQFNKEKSVLLIATNNEVLISKHILLRKVIIPSYYSGLHPYWNQGGLLFYNNKYVVVK